MENAVIMYKLAYYVHYANSLLFTTLPLNDTFFGHQLPLRGQLDVLHRGRAEAGRLPVIVALRVRQVHQHREAGAALEEELGRPRTGKVVVNWGGGGEKV